MNYVNIFVTRLNYKTTAAELYELFSAFGEIKSAKIIIDANTGLSKGYGFVLMPNAIEANYAVQQLNESIFCKRKIIVKISDTIPTNRI